MWLTTGLDAAVTAFSLFIRDLCPEARLDISFTRYENEDAHIWVSLPSTMSAQDREQVANHRAEKSLDILLTEGFLILAGLEEPVVDWLQGNRGRKQPYGVLF